MAASFRPARGGFDRGLRPFLLVALMVLLAPAARFAAAQGEDEDIAANATVRAVHAVPGSPEVDVLIDGQPMAEAIGFGSATDYVPVPPGDHTLQVVPTGQPPEAAIAEAELGAAPARAYVFVALGPLNEAQGKIFEVNLDEIEPGRARARLIQAAPDAGPLDLTITGGDALFTDVGFGDATDYADVEPGTYSFDVRGEEDRVLGTVPDVTIDEGRVYDVVALGQVADQSLNLLTLVTRVSPPCTEVLGLEGTSEDACIRLVHAAPDAPAVDVYVNDSPLVEGLAFGTATEYVALPSGEGRTVRLTAAGSPADQSILAADLGFEVGQAYEILATGAEGDLQLTITGVDLRPIPENQARIRVIHASPDAGALDVGIQEGPTLYEGLDFRGIGEYRAIDEGDYTLQVRPAGDELVALATDLMVEAGTVYDVIAVGRREDQSLALWVLTAPAQVREGAVASPAAEVMATPAAAGTVVPIGTPEPADEAMAETVVAVEPGTATPGAP